MSGLISLLPEGRKKAVQLVRLKQWATEQGCWYSDRSLKSDTGGLDTYRSLSPRAST